MTFEYSYMNRPSLYLNISCSQLVEIGTRDRKNLWTWLRGYFLDLNHLSQVLVLMRSILFMLILFFKSKFPLIHADTILKKYSSTVATIFTGIASAVLFGHALTMNFILGISIVFISMHQVNVRPCIYFIYFVHWRRGLEEQEGG